MIVWLVAFVGALNIAVTYFFYFELKKLLLSDIRNIIKDVVEEIVREELQRFFGDEG